MQEALSDPVRIVVGTVGQANEDIRQEVLVLKASPLGVVGVGCWVGLGGDLVAGTGYRSRLARRPSLTPSRPTINHHHNRTTRRSGAG